MVNSIAKLKEEKAELEEINIKLKENERKRINFYNERYKALEERIKNYESNKVVVSEKYKEEISEMKTQHTEEIKKLNNEYAKKGKELDEQNIQAKIKQNSSDSKIKELIISLNDLKISKEEELRELRKRLQNEYELSLADTTKKLEQKLKSLEQSRGNIMLKTNDEILALSQNAKSNMSNIISRQNELDQVKADLLSITKENEALKSKVDEKQTSKDMSSKIMSRVDEDRRVLASEIKKIKEVEKTQIDKLKDDQDKERKWFKELKGEFEKRIAELEKRNSASEGQLLSIKQCAARMTEELITSVKQIVGEKFKESSY